MSFKLMRRPDANKDDWYEWKSYAVAEIPAMCMEIEELSCLGYKYGNTLKVEVLFE